MSRLGKLFHRHRWERRFIVELAAFDQALGIVTKEDFVVLVPFDKLPPKDGWYHFWVCTKCSEVGFSAGEETP